MTSVSHLDSKPVSNQIFNDESKAVVTSVFKRTLIVSLVLTWNPGYAFTSAALSAIATTVSIFTKPFFDDLLGEKSVGSNFIRNYFSIFVTLAVFKDPSALAEKISTVAFKCAILNSICTELFNTADKKSVFVFV